MKAPFYFSRFVAIFLSFSLSLSSPALALRPQNPGTEDNSRLNRQISGALLAGQPAAGLEEGRAELLFTHKFKEDTGSGASEMYERFKEETLQPFFDKEHDSCKLMDGHEIIRFLQPGVWDARTR
ncbi:MAG: hypothetical protein HY211_07145 [Candidatus Omnitrophica bacterium]|nr:hypothetical protein [Candidatus Omnitrophota bacterium]